MYSTGLEVGPRRAHPALPLCGTISDFRCRAIHLFLENTLRPFILLNSLFLSLWLFHLFDFPAFDFYFFKMRSKETLEVGKENFQKF